MNLEHIAVSLNLDMKEFLMVLLTSTNVQQEWMTVIGTLTVLISRDRTNANVMQDIQDSVQNLNYFHFRKLHFSEFKFWSLKGDGFDCDDFNECEYNRGDCHVLADCINTEGGHVCECQPVRFCWQIKSLYQKIKSFYIRLQLSNFRFLEQPGR